MAAGDRVASPGIGEQAEVPDAYEAARKHVQEKASEEFLDGECHEFRAPMIGIVLPAKLDETIGEADQARIRDGNAVRVAAEVPEHLLGPTKRPLRIDHPGRRLELGDERGEPRGLGERRRARGEGQLVGDERAVEPRQVTWRGTRPTGP